MACPQNRKKLLWVSYNGPHKFWPISVDFSGGYWIVLYECENCCAQKKAILTDVEIGDRGYDIEKLREVHEWDGSPERLPIIGPDIARYKISRGR